MLASVGLLLLCSRAVFSQDNDTSEEFIYFWQVSSLVNETNLASALTYSLNGRTCSQIYVVDNPVAEQVLSLIHNTLLSPSLVNGIEVERHLKCNFRTYISSTVDDMEQLLIDHPMKRSNFLILLYDEDEEEFYEFVEHTGSKQIGSGRGVLINFIDTTLVFKYSSIHKQFFKATIDNIFQEENIHEGQKYEDFHGKTLRLGTFNCSVHSQVGPLNRNGTPNWIDGVELMFIHDLSLKLNFSYQVIVPTDRNKIGSLQEDGRWSGGLMSMIERKEADIVFCGLWLTGDKRSSSLSYTSPITDLCLTFLVPRPVPFNSKGIGLLKTFGWIVWVTIGTETIVIALLVTLAAYFGSSYFDRYIGIRGYKKFDKSFIIFWSILFSNAPKSLPILGPLRHLLAWWAVFALIVNSTFSGSLSSHLTKAFYYQPYDSFKGLVQNDFFWCRNFFDAFDSVFNMDDEWEFSWVMSYCTATPKQQCHIIKKPNLHYSVFAIKWEQGNVVSDFPCTSELKRYEAMSGCFNKVYTGFLLQYRSPYEKIFSDYITRYQEAGVFAKEYRGQLHKLTLKESYVHDTNIRTGKRTNARVKIKLSNILVVFYLFFIGISLAVLAFLMELLWFHRRAILKPFQPTL